MNGALVLSACLGVAAVLQAGMNRAIGTEWGLLPAVFLNSLVLFVAVSGLFALMTARPELFPEAFQNRGAFKSFSPWFLLPGLFGLCLVSGIPFAISKAGALRVFVTVVAFQMAAGLGWDTWIEGVAVSPRRIAGAVLALLGALLTASGR